jgi:hypothetical protein
VRSPCEFDLGLEAPPAVGRRDEVSVGRPAEPARRGDAVVGRALCVVRRSAELVEPLVRPEPGREAEEPPRPPAAFVRPSAERERPVPPPALLRSSAGRERPVPPAAVLRSSPERGRPPPAAAVRVLRVEELPVGRRWPDRGVDDPPRAPVVDWPRSDGRCVPAVRRDGPAARRAPRPG